MQRNIAVAIRLHIKITNCKVLHAYVSQCLFRAASPSFASRGCAVQSLQIPAVLVRSNLSHVETELQNPSHPPVRTVNTSGPLEGIVWRAFRSTLEPIFFAKVATVLYTISSPTSYCFQSGRKKVHQAQANSCCLHPAHRIVHLHPQTKAFPFSQFDRSPLDQIADRIRRYFDCCKCYKLGQAQYLL
jgi:hypothetical protein